MRFKPKLLAAVVAAAMMAVGAASAADKVVRSDEPIQPIPDG